ncbi:MAG: RNA polymerase sigma factor [Chloroflexi bacterium]|nr:MAG: RNA polymerase sigma factor [Chloroflexota bacterium]
MSESMPIGPLAFDPAAEGAAQRDPDFSAVSSAQHDRATFAVLYRRYLDAVYSYAFYQLGDHHDAEDVTARTFMAALRGIGSFRNEGASFRAWLFRIARNTIANAHRTRARRRTEPMDAIPLEPPAPDADPAGLALQAEEARRIRAAVIALPDDRRQVVLLRFADGLSAREIGEVLDRSEGAVRVLLHRALKDLAGHLRR